MILLIQIMLFTRQKSKSFAANKCKISKIETSRHTDHSVNIDEHRLDVVDEFRYLGDEFTSKGDNSALC